LFQRLEKAGTGESEIIVKPSKQEGSKYSLEKLKSLNLLFDGKSIRKEKGTVKEKNRAEGKGGKVLLEKLGFCSSGLYK
jgi:hypothetical protein